jgi:vacuolar-type H+-ATPase subunit C/Vma6
VDLTLQRWHFKDARRRLEGLGGGARTLEEALHLEADLINLGVILRFADRHSSQEAQGRSRGDNGIKPDFVGPGRISRRNLLKALDGSSLHQAIQDLKGEPYTDPLEAGLKEYDRTGRLSAFERHLYRFRLRWRAGRITRDPLGIGVLLGYQALLANEIRNLRWIAHGVHWEMEVEEIVEHLEFVG